MAKKNKATDNVEAVEKVEGQATGTSKEVKHASTKNSDYKYVIENQKVRRAASHKKIVKIAAIILAILLAGIGVFYGAYTAVEINSFKVFVDSSGSKILSLSSTLDFAYGTEQLEIAGPNKMDNTTLASGKNLVNTSAIEDRLADIIASDGFECGEQDKFIAATFYLKNVTTNEQAYNEVLNLRSSTKGIEKALRVMLVRKRTSEEYYELNVYAKYNQLRDENGELVFDAEGKAVLKPEEVVPLTKTKFTKMNVKAIGTEEGGDTVEVTHEGSDAWIAEDFYSSEYIFYNTNFIVAPQEIIKYSIILWLEGWDEDCTDDKLLGTIRMDFAFEQSTNG